MATYGMTQGMSEEHALRTVAGALGSPTVVDFVKSSVKAGYIEFFSEYRVEVCAM